VSTADQPNVAIDEEPSRVFRFVAIVAVFLLAGPPAGGFVVWGFMLVNMALLHHGVPYALQMLFMVVLYAYPLGAPFALVAGIIHAVAAIRMNKNSFLVPLVSAVLVSIVGVALFVAVKPWPGTFAGEVLSGIIMVMPPSLFASFVCWRLTRPLARIA
jgi:hypothetical protein